MTSNCLHELIPTEEEVNHDPLTCVASPQVTTCTAVVTNRMLPPLCSVSHENNEEERRWRRRRKKAITISGNEPLPACLTACLLLSVGCCVCIATTDYKTTLARTPSFKERRESGKIGLE